MTVSIVPRAKLGSLREHETPGKDDSLAGRRQLDRQARLGLAPCRLDGRCAHLWSPLRAPPLARTNDGLQGVAHELFRISDRFLACRLPRGLPRLVGSKPAI